jgi:hypothetical protein
MQYYGRAGLWDDFVKFQAEARKARLLERNERSQDRSTSAGSMQALSLLVVLDLLALTLSL